MNKYICAFIALFLLSSCQKESLQIRNAENGSRNIAVRLSQPVTKTGIADLETLKSKSFFLYIDQDGSSMDYKVELCYDAANDVWKAQSFDGSEVKMLWLNEPDEKYLAGVTVAAIFYDRELSFEEKAQLFTDEFEYLIPTEDVGCPDILYASSKMEGSISYGADGTVNICFSHLLGKLELSPLSDTRKTNMTVGGLSRAFRWLPHDNTIIPLAASELVLPTKNGIQTVYTAPHINSFYIEISPDRWTFKDEILSGKSYFIDLDKQ